MPVCHHAQYPALASNILCISSLFSWFPPQHAPLSQEVSLQPAARQHGLHLQLLQCSGCSLRGGTEVPAAASRQTPPHSACGYVMLCSALGVILDLMFCVDSNNKVGLFIDFSPRNVLKVCLYFFIRKLSKGKLPLLPPLPPCLL